MEKGEKDAAAIKNVPRINSFLKRAGNDEEEDVEELANVSLEESLPSTSYTQPQLTVANVNFSEVVVEKDRDEAGRSSALQNKVMAPQVPSSLKALHYGDRLQRPSGRKLYPEGY